jgi:hypothetical protein
VINIEQWSKLLRQWVRHVPASIVVEDAGIAASADARPVYEGVPLPGGFLIPQNSRLQFLERHNAMQDVDIRVDQAFWASSILPEGIVQRWFIADGSIAETGDKMAEIRIEDALHEITAPVRGRLTIIAAVNNVVEPGSLLGTLAVV